MGKSTHFLGQPILGQLLNYLNNAKILQFSHDGGGERYVKKFNAWCHLTVMLYAVISRFDSVSPDGDALRSHLALRLPARNHLCHNDGVPQASAPGHYGPAATLHAL